MSRSSLRAFRTILKDDLSDIKELMKYKVARDNYVLLGDTQFEAARNLNQIRPEFTIDPQWLRRRRPSYPDPPSSNYKMRVSSLMKPRYEAVWEADSIAYNHEPEVKINEKGYI